MPNWVYNYLDIAGSKEDISAIKQQLNAPFTRTHENYNMETSKMETKEYTFTNPVFSFWNIIKPTDLDAYALQPDHSKDPFDGSGDDWYNWNVRNWGTKWDVSVSDDEEYPETEMYQEGEDVLGYKFNTAWSPPIPAIAHLSTLYPNLTFTLSYEEETGWGGEFLIINGNGSEIETYDNKCRDCDSLDTMEYCDNDCGEICNACHYMGEADLDCVAECDIHKVFLDNEHVPEYRRG